MLNKSCIYTKIPVFDGNVNPVYTVTFFYTQIYFYNVLFDEDYESEIRIEKIKKLTDLKFVENASSNNYFMDLLTIGWYFLLQQKMRRVTDINNLKTELEKVKNLRRY